MFCDSLLSKLVKKTYLHETIFFLRRISQELTCTEAKKMIFKVFVEERLSHFGPILFHILAAIQVVRTPGER